MSVPSGRLQFFALEAGDYLERLGMIVGRPTPPDPDELVRLTRALRGASLMAGLSAFSHAAGALEHIAKAHRAGQWAGGPAASELLADAIEELNIGHSIVSRAVITGMYAAVSEMRRIVRAARGLR